MSRGPVKTKACDCGGEVRIRQLASGTGYYIVCPSCSYECGCDFKTEREAKAWWNAGGEANAVD